MEVPDGHNLYNLTVTNEEMGIALQTQICTEAGKIDHGFCCCEPGDP